MTCDQQFEALVVRLNKAESENVQLKAQVNKLKDGVTHFNSSRGDLNPLLEAYIKTPEQCLNSVKIEAYKEGFCYSCGVYNGDSSTEVIDVAVNSYSEQLNNI